ncbi:MAG TPA: ATP-binding protein, partial [Flavobacterium sp.]|nr:ATP-binding protein [Flavobacterium sp.]
DKQAKLPEKLINEATINGRSLNEGYRVRKDGSKFWASVAITALHDNNGNIIGFSKVTRDLTERKIAEDKMQQYNAELEFQNKELEQFAYVTSHDLQEPLRKIQMFTDLLYKNINNRDAVNKYFGKINNSASRMVDLIKSVLNYSKLSSSTDQFVKTDLNQILTNVLTDFELLIEEKKAVIKKDKLPCLTAIPLQINQLFSNLIGNSLKFTDVQPQLTISHKTINRKDIPFQNNLQNTNYLEITFSDNGIGFDQKYVSQIFAAFQRLNERAAYGGTGIGLALCKKIVENHRGMITAQSEPGKGASFFIYLPVEK